MSSNDDSKNETKQSDLAKLRAALKAGKTVEIERHTGFPSASYAAASESARQASEANARGERVARILDEHGEREFECGVHLNEVFDLLKEGAVER